MSAPWIPTLASWPMGVLLFLEEVCVVISDKHIFLVSWWDNNKKQFSFYSCVNILNLYNIPIFLPKHRVHTIDIVHQCILTSQKSKELYVKEEVFYVKEEVNCVCVRVQHPFILAWWCQGVFFFFCIHLLYKIDITHNMHRIPIYIFPNDGLPLSKKKSTASL